jgi:hypothetical protein
MTRCISIFLFSDNVFTEDAFVADGITLRATKNDIKLLGLMTSFRNLLI